MFGNWTTRRHYISPTASSRTSDKMQQESLADAGIPARRKNDEKIPPFRSYNKYQSSRKSGVYSN